IWIRQTTFHTSLTCGFLCLRHQWWASRAFAARLHVPNILQTVPSVVQELRVGERVNFSVIGSSMVRPVVLTCGFLQFPGSFSVRRDLGSWSVD
ncbi:hypothetical protein NPIL_376391, partial [Nephila pilipes]